MNFNDQEWISEIEWLEEVLGETRKQLDENNSMKDRLETDTRETQKEMWQDLGSVSISNGLEQIADFMSYINTMKNQKRSNEFAIKLEEKFERILLSPYFGRFDFDEKNTKVTEKCYIGISNLIRENCEFMIYDWRAPISSMFYDYEIGEAQYDCPDGIIKGEIILKRQYKISDGNMEYMFDSNLKIDDEILQNMLSKNTDQKMKAIVTTIQREQNQVIRNEAYNHLIVQGAAGSGKTSVALHRIAYLLYKHRETITAKNILIFSPNGIFNDYISNVLPQLGEDNMSQTTFSDYMHAALGPAFRKEKYSDMMEYIFGADKNDYYQIRVGSIKLKSSPEFYEILKQYVEAISSKDRNFKDIVFNNQVIISSEEIKVLFFEEYANLPLKRRLQKIKERMLFLIEPYKKRRIKDEAKRLVKSSSIIDKTELTIKSKALVNAELKSILDEIERMTTCNFVELYRNLYRSKEYLNKSSFESFSVEQIKQIKKYTVENLNAGILYYEDQAPLLLLKVMLGELPKTTDIKFVIIDEAQDYTAIQYDILYHFFSHANITILGDLNQSINPYMNVGDYALIEKIFPRQETLRITLNKSYRSTIEIIKFSRDILKKSIEDECVERSGELPQVVSFNDSEEIFERIIKDVKHYKENGYKSVGIITKSVKQTEYVYAQLKDRVHVNAIIHEDDEYICDTVIIPIYLAKGLEFDVVIIYDVNTDNYCGEEDRLQLYTACTRALHVLNLYYQGEKTYLF